MLSSTATGCGQTQAGEGDASVADLAAYDPVAWQQLFDWYYQKMYRFAYARIGNQDAAEEVASEVFAAAAKGIGRYKQTGAPFAAWLYRIARNKTADYLTSHRRHPVISIDLVEVAGGAWTGNVEDAADLATALSHLTREQQEVIVLRFYSDCSLQVAAVALGKSVGAVKVLQHRALTALRKRLTTGGQQ